MRTVDMEPIDAEKLAALWTQAQRRIEAYIYSVVPDFSETDDILQNVAMVIVRKRETYDPSKPFLGWAISIAKLEILKHRRTRARDRHCFDDTLLDQISASHEEASIDMVQQRQALAHCLQQVKGRSRSALVMRYVQGLAPAGIAESLGMAAGAARMLLMRVRESLRKCIQQHLAKGSP